MRRRVVRQPAHHDRRAGEDARADEEGAAILDQGPGCGDEHDVADDGHRGAYEHEDAALLVLVRQVRDDQDGEEGGHVGRDGEQVGIYLGVAEGGDDGGEEEGEGVDGRDDGEEVDGEEDGVPVQKGEFHPVPGEFLAVDVRGGGRAVAVEFHAVRRDIFLFFR